MKIYKGFEGYDSILVCGDIHGEFRTLLFELKRRKIENVVVIVAGDCGIGFERPAHYIQLYNKLALALEMINCQLLLIRGNHDDPAYFRDEAIDLPFMKTIPDYSIVQFKNRNILCIGGAISVDRKPRLDNMRMETLKGHTVQKSYWEDESAFYCDGSFSAIRSAGISIDTVVTHTAPSFCHPTTKAGIEYWIEMDAKLAEDLALERQTMDQIHSRLIADNHPVRKWYYGHFHDSHTEFISEVKYSMLNILELREL